MDKNCLLCDASAKSSVFPSQNLKSTLCKALRLPEQTFLKKMDHIKFCSECGDHIQRVQPIVSALESLETTLEEFMRNVSKRLRTAVAKKYTTYPASKNLTSNQNNLTDIRQAIVAG